MAHQCGSCDGTGQCQNDFHNIYDGMIDTVIGGGGECPACGEPPGVRGNCSVCGGSGRQDDD